MMSETTELELQRSLGRLEGKVDALIAEIRTERELHDDAHKMHLARIITLEKQVAALERWKMWLLGASAAVAVIMGVAWKLLAMAQ